MKVLFFSSGLADHYGGAAVSESSLVKYLIGMCNITVLCRQNRTDKNFTIKTDISNNVQTYTANDVIKLIFRKQTWLMNLFESVDIVHLNGHWKWEYYIFAVLLKSLNKPFLLQPRGMGLIGHRRVVLKKIFNLFLGNYIIRNANIIVCLSNFEKRQLDKYNINQFKVIPNGIDVIDIDIKNKRRLPPYFLYLGRIEARKNLIFLIKAFSRYRNMGGKGELVLIGPVERNYDKILFKACRELNIERLVKILTPIYSSDKFSYISSSLAVIYPAYEEAFGRVPFEVLSIGALPIIPDESGSAEYLFPLIKMCIYKQNDTDDLVKKMVWAEALEDRFGITIKAKNWIRENLNWEHIAQEFINTYEKLLVVAN